MSRRLLLVAALVVLTAGMSLAQVPGIGIGIGDPVQLDTVAPADTQGVVFPITGLQPPDYSGAPDTGEYHILINGWIEAFAYVSVWDNWISFGVMDPTTGTYSSPGERFAFSETGAGTYASGGTDWVTKGGAEEGGQDPIYAVNNSTMNFDLAGLLIETNARLDLAFDMGGLMTRCQSDGTAFTGVDTRRVDGGYYQLANQYKMAFKGRFLQFDLPLSGDPAQDDPGIQYVSPTSLDTTDYNTWTDWGMTVNAIDDAGWLWPVEFGTIDANDPWTGNADMANVLIQTGDPGNNLQFLTVVVERGQAQGVPGSLNPIPGDDGPSEAAEVWFAERVMRRGLQDVAGNYRADRYVWLTYREADTQWTPVEQ